MHDRLRAKPPTTEVDAWTEATVVAVAATESGHVVTVAGPEGTVEVALDGALYDLFAGRIEGEVRGARCWYR